MRKGAKSTSSNSCLYMSIKSTLLLLFKVMFFDIESQLIINYESIKKGYGDILSNKLVWNIDKNNTILIFDEVHRCKDPKSLNAKLLMSSKGLCKSLLLSATLADTPDNFYVYGYMLNLFNTMKQCRTLMSDIIKNGKNNMSNINPINLFIFPKYGSIMVNDKLPKNIISAICYDM